MRLLWAFLVIYAAVAGANVWIRYSHAGQRGWLWHTQTAADFATLCAFAGLDVIVEHAALSALAWIIAWILAGLVVIGGMVSVETVAHWWQARQERIKRTAGWDGGGR